MAKFCVLLSVLLMLQVSRACDGSNEEDQLGSARQQSDDYYANAYGFTPETWNALYYPSSLPVTGNYETIFKALFSFSNKYCQHLRISWPV